MSKLESVKRFVEELYSAQRHSDTNAVLQELEDCRKLNKQPVIPSATANRHTEGFTFGKMQYFFVHPNEEPSNDRLIIYLHGGAYIYQPLDAHWSLTRRLARALGCDVILPVYLKAPNYTCEQSVSSLVEFYKSVIIPRLTDKTEVVFMGDSAGGSLCLVLAQQLVLEGIANPKHILMFSPSVDLSFTNEAEARSIEPSDPMLQLNRLKIIRNIWRDKLDSTDPRVSPIYGNLNVGQLTVFTGTNEILLPDARLLKRKAEEQNLKINYFEYPDMFHAFVLFPIDQAQQAIEQVIGIIENDC